MEKVIPSRITHGHLMLNPSRNGKRNTRSVRGQIHPKPADKTHVAKIIAEYTEYNYTVQAFHGMDTRASVSSQRAVQ